MKQVDQMLSTESTLIDKDVLNALRSSSTENKWRLSLDASFKIFGIGASSSGAYEGSAKSQVSSTINHIHESNKKSAQTLKFLQKTEVISRTETSVEQRAGRILRNPYDDRSITFRIFDIVKIFSLKTYFAGLNAVISIDVSGLKFTPDFVLSNQAFVFDYLLDTDLLEELSDTEPARRAGVPEEDRVLARSYAAEAFEYLFDDNVVLFGHAEYGDKPSSSFDRGAMGFGGDHESSAFYDAQTNSAIRIITALAYYYRWYKSGNHATRIASDDVVRRALALASYAGKKWEALSQNDASDLSDYKDRTEVFRRLPGFLSLVDGIIRPLLGDQLPKPSATTELEPEEGTVGEVEEETPKLLGLQLQSGPAQRIAAHMNHYRLHYVAEYVSYLEGLSDAAEVRGFARQVLQLIAQQQQLASHLFRKFDLDRLVVSETEILVPTRGMLNDAELGELDKVAPKNLKLAELVDTKFNDLVENVELPADGVHIEPVEGECILKGLPTRSEGSLRLKDLDARVKIKK